MSETGSIDQLGLVADMVVHRGDGFTLEMHLTIGPGTTVALLGPNGAGKSTAVQALAGLVAIEHGSIELAGRTLDDPSGHVFVPPEQRNVGIVFQEYLLFDHLSVLDNVAFGLRSRGHNRRQARSVADRLLKTVGIDDLADRRPKQLSGGQAQRVAVARALAVNPDLLLLDEPLAALDVTTRTALRRALAEHLRTFAGPRLLITHEPADAFALADRICILEDGRITQTGTPDEVRRHPNTPYVAALTGTNLLSGCNRNGTITLDQDAGAEPDAGTAGDRRSELQGFELRTATLTEGRVQAVIDPRAISLHRERPKGSPRNTWRCVIDWIEPIGETTRIKLSGPLPVLVDITPAAATALELGPGSPVWAAVKATEVQVTPA